MRVKAFLQNALLRGSALVAVGRVGAMVFGLGINMILARLLSLDTLGAYFLISSVTQVGGLVAMGGTSQSAVPVLAGRKDDEIRPALRGITLYGMLAIALCGTLVFVVFDHIAAAIGVQDVSRGVAVLVALWLVARSAAQFIAHLLRAFGRMALFGLLETFLFNAMFFAVLAGYGLAGARPGFEEIVIATTIIASLGVPIALIPLWRVTARLPQSSGVDLRAAVSVSLPLWVMVLANTALADAHLWITGALGSSESAALFGAALRVVRLLSMPLLAVNMAIGPRTAQLWRQGRKRELEHLMRVSATGVMAVSLVVVSGLLIAGPITLRLLFGPDFIAAWPAFLILLAGQTLNVSTGSPVLLMSVTSAQRQVMVFSLISGVIGICLSLLLGRSDPVSGVAVGSAVAVVLQNLFAVYYCRVHLGIQTLPALLPSAWRGR